MSRSWACCFWVFPQNIIAKHRSLNWKKTSENNRYRWLNKNNRTDCDGKDVQKPSTSHRCYIKNIGIASLSKIDHRSCLVWMMLKEPCKQNPEGQKIHFAPKQSHLPYRVDLLARLVQDSTFRIVLANLFDSGSRWGGIGDSDPRYRAQTSGLVFKFSCAA